MEPFRARLWKKYMKLKGFVWDGYKSPEQCPDIQSGQVLALAEMVEELENRVEILEGLEKAKHLSYGQGGRP